MAKYLTKDDAKLLNKLEHAEESDLRDAVSRYGDEHQWIGYLEGSITATLTILGGIIASSVVDAFVKCVDRKFIEFEEKKQKEFIYESEK